MNKETETALVFAATIIMQQVCDNPKLLRRQRDKMRKWAGILSGLADKETSNEPTNAEVLADGLNDFALKEDFTQEEIVDYISCPSTSPCDYDGGSNHDCCTRCKVKWLLSKWED